VLPAHPGRRHGAATSPFIAVTPADADEPIRPDPPSVRLHDAGYRYPQYGWTVLHVEGEPYDRERQHG
jgi:hypothetical protein